MSRLRTINSKIIESNNRLSCGMNLTSKPVTLNLNTIKKETHHTNLELKSKLKVYLSDDNRKFIDKSAAYALGLTEVRVIMIENQDKYFEITDKQLETIKMKNYEIEYSKIENKEVPEKPVINVYNDGIDSYIDLSAAYALGLITDQNFNNMGNELYKVSENLLIFINNKYKVDRVVLEEEQKSTGVK